ncbi:biotin--[acetyl-CoA-carboxylase] ligase [Antiquaquibacter soli]|uniref:biotin--[biotin carboxyl-carrier protein] ligase n=1 Tax=Antiquaquibacter soli TaxID=3064523 RepID=A0ABT9BJB2_9MICO|nr:biotin--[acetyl-CoA-carboxylase] ligase [Protaetiibacter sp. WY-16]MDO7881101.1 biotin--[acetyl-CoA-carboxylase] ligase [Protaetiibacter sp. WY-16]
MRVQWLPEIDSTNRELVRLAALGGVEHLTALATTNQTAGRGRLGRTWTAPAGTTIAVSVFIAGGPDAPAFATRMAWLPLAAGLAMTRTVRSLLPGRPVSLKWPNDVQVDGLKVSGILGEIVPAAGAVLGAGLNLTMSREQLPVATATSLTLEGAGPEDLVERAASAYLSELESAWRAFEEAGFDPEAGLRASVSAVCGTIGRDVRVELPDGSELFGVAEAIDAEGRLVVGDESGRRAVAAGDVTHLRHR